MKVGSLFAGIGGFDLGLERAGMETVWQVEIDDYCNKVLEKHWPDVKRYRDVKEVGKHNLEPVDLICGGFPCQPFSTAGKQEGKEDDRYLWPEMLRVIKELRPHWVIGENVAGLIHLGLDECLSNLESEGYTCRTFIIPACAVNAPHKRNRLWILAYAQQYGLEDYSKKLGDHRFKEPRALASKCFEGALQQDGRIWPSESRVRRMADGFSNWMDRLRGIGNAVVPQIPEILGRMIMEIENAN